MAIKHTIIYQSHFELMSGLTDEQAGLLIKSIGIFQTGVEPTITEPLVKGIFLAIKRDFILQSENYEKKKQANRTNGLKGGRPKTQTNPQNPMGYLETQPNPQNLKDKEKDKEKDIDKEKDKDIDKDINNKTVSNNSVKYINRNEVEYLNKNTSVEDISKLFVDFI
jgi:hypothetical protein